MGWENRPQPAVAQRKHHAFPIFTKKALKRPFFGNLEMDYSVNHRECGLIRTKNLQTFALHPANYCSISCNQVVNQRPFRRQRFPMNSSPSTSPRILSFNELQIDLTDEVRSHLASDYRLLYENDAENAAKRHLDHVLQAMKLAPSSCTCRINQILSNKDEIISGLRLAVNKWKSRNGDGGGINYGEVVKAHPTLQDVVYVNVPDTLGENLSKCRIPRLRPNIQPSNLFPNGTKREEKGWPMNNRVIICDRFCGEAVLRGSDIFVRGVMCADLGIVTGDKVAVYADLNDGSYKTIPRGLVLEKYNGRCVFLGLGKACCSRADIFKSSKGVAVEMSAEVNERAGPVLPPLHGILPGKCHLQNLPSVLVAHALSPQQGDVILDMCSAPGGKTSHAASLVQNNATIIACDKSRKKMVSAREMFSSMGATCITPLALDSTSCVVRSGAKWKSVNEILSSATPSVKDGLLNIKKFYPGSFDKIILDPPCSALGLRPKLMIESTTVEELEKHSYYQRAFVKEAVALLKEGGIMTYSTCTILSSENERMVRYILDEYPCMKLVPIGVRLGCPGLPGMGLTEEEQNSVRRFDPSKIKKYDPHSDTMGFFVSKFVKSSEDLKAYTIVLLQERHRLPYCQYLL